MKKKSLIYVLTMILLFGIISIGVKAATITLYWPVDLGIKINNAYSSSHLGVDFAAAKGSAVYAAAAGTVTIYDNGCTGSHYTDTDAWCSRGTSCPALSAGIGDYGGWGNYIEINHGNGYKTRYAHMITGSWAVSSGSYVEAGTYLGQIGNAGYTTGYHLHFELVEISTKTRLNPANYLINEKPGSSGSTSDCSCSDSYAGVYTVVKDDVNMRSGHGASYDLVTTIPLGSRVTVLKASGTGTGNWAHVIWNDYVGYASMNYLEQVPTVDVGSSFYAFIINTAPWKLATNNNGNVELWAESGSYNQLWYFERQSDGTYKIISCSDGYSLDVEGAYKTSGTNVQTYPYHGGDAQRWYVTGTAGSFVISARCASTVLDVSGGWSDDGTNIQMWEHHGQSAQLFQIYQLNTYTVSYDANGGSGAPANQQKVQSVHLPLSSEIPTRSGYTFLGWSTNASATSATYGAGATFSENANTTLYAVWKPITYTVSYDANGGSGAPSSQTKTYGQTLTLSSTVPTRTGYTFLGWSTSASATSASYGAGSSFTTNANTTLYAVWKINTYTISYDANGGSGAPSSQTKTYDQTLTLSSIVPTRTGYTFLGWSTSSGATSASYVAGGSFTTNANTTLYAVWQIDTYTISYNANGGSGAPSSQTKTYGQTLTLSSTVPTRTGYTFLGWSTSSGATSASYAAGGSFTTNANTTLYAVWKPITYTVSYDANGGSGAPSSQTKTYGTTLTLSSTVPTRTGYTFLGWSTSASATSATYTAGGTFTLNGDTTLYAVWKVGCAGTCSFVDYEVETTPTEGEGGLIIGTCEYCSATNALALPKLNTTDYTYKVRTAATCTADGIGRYTWKTTTYGTFYFDVTISATGHEYKSVVVSPTCTAKGYTEFTCESCGDCYKEDYTNALGHNYENGTCTRCGEKDETSNIVTSGTCGTAAKWQLDSNGVLTISGTGTMKNYTYKSEMPWYSYRDQIVTVVIESGVTSIGDYAFYGMPKMTAITIPETVTSIGNYAFKNSTALKTANLPSGLTKLGESAFYACSSLTSIEIPSSLWTVQPYTFKNCTSLKSVTFHEGNLQKISDGAFYNTALTEVTLPNCLTILDVYVFKNCSSLATVTLSSSLTQIREASLYGTAISTIEIPEGVTSIKPYAFKNCINLKTISLPSTLTSIDEASFYACTALKSLEMPDAVTSIGNYAFRKCTALSNVDFSANLNTIGESSFYGCSALTSLSIPEKVTTIKGYAFKGCIGVASVSLPDSLVTLGESAFHTCTGLTEIVIPNNVGTIGAYCFSGSTNLADVYVLSTSCEIGSAGTTLGVKASTNIHCYEGSTAETYAKTYGYSYDYITSDEGAENVIASGTCGTDLTWKLTEDYELVISGSGDMDDFLTSVSNGVTTSTIPWYEYSQDIVKVSLPENLTKIGNSAFADFESLASIIIPDKVTIIGEHAFYKNYKLDAITIPESVTTIMCNAFADCTGLKEVIIPGNVVKVDECIFRNCTGLTKATILDGLTYIGYYMFDGCTSLKEVSIPDSVTLFRNFAFANCTSLESIDIPDGVTDLNQGVFQGCTELTQITIPENVEDISMDVFRECTSLTSITIPSSVTTIGGRAFMGCTSLQDLYIQNAECIIEADYNPEQTLGVVGMTTIHGYADSTAQVYAETYGYTFEAIDAENILASGTCGTNLTWKLTDDYELTISGSGDMDDFLTSVSNGVTTSTIPWYDYRSEIVKVTLEDGVTRIGNSAFSNFTSITSAVIPNTVTTIGEYAFYKSTNLAKVSIPSSVTTIESSAFRDCGSIVNITIPNSVTTIYSSAFKACTGLTSIVIPSGMTAIREYTFDGCTSLKDVTIPDGVTLLRNFAFANCTSLKSIDIPDGVTDLYQGVFQGCTNLTQITIPDSVEGISMDVFRDCTSLTTITIPANVSEIGGRAFQGCTALTDIYIKNAACEIESDYNPEQTLGVVGTTTVHGYEGSTAQTHAETYGYNFEVIPQENSVEASINLIGEIELEQVVVEASADTAILNAGVEETVTEESVTEETTCTEETEAETVEEMSTAEVVEEIEETAEAECTVEEVTSVEDNNEVVIESESDTTVENCYIEEVAETTSTPSEEITTEYNEVTSQPDDECVDDLQTAEEQPVDA